MICAVMAMPRSAAMSAASSSSSDAGVSLGERVTMRLISWASLAVRFVQAGFELVQINPCVKFELRMTATRRHFRSAQLSP